MDQQVRLGVYRRFDNRIEGLSDDSPRALELHNRRKGALHDVLDSQNGIEVVDWGLTDDSQPHEFVELMLRAVGVAAFQYAVVPGLKFVAQKLAEKAVDSVTSELVKALVSWIRPKQESKEVLDFLIKLPDGTDIHVDPPDSNASITIQFADGKVESVTYVQP